MNSRPGSDELISINPTFDLVTFDDIPPYYVPGQDIFVIFQLGSDFKATSRDWVGLFPCGWDNIAKYLAFQWSPKQPRNAKFANIRSVLFLGKDIKVEPNPTEKYQFLYISKGDHVVGVSRSFVFSEFSPDGVTCTDQTEASDQPDLLDNFDLLTGNSSADSDSDSDLPLLIPITEDHFTLVDPQVTSDCLKIVSDNEDNHEEKAVVPYRPVLPIFTAAQDRPTAEMTAEVNMPPSLKDMALNTACTRPTVSAVSKSSTDKVFLDFVSLLKDLTSPPSPERPLADKTPTVSSTTRCKACRRRSVLLAAGEKKYSQLEKEQARLRRQVEELRDKEEMKTLLVEELSKQVKNLISENSMLVTMKEKLQNQMDWWECSSCRKKEKEDSATVRELKADNSRLRQENEELESQLWTVQGERNDLQQSLDTLKCQQHDLGERYYAQEAHLNDIMYTLSTKGVEKIVDCNGNQTSTDVTGGTLLDLDGWQVASSKKTAKQLAAMATKDGMVRRLKDSIQELETNIASLQTELKQLKTDAKAKSSERDQVKGQLDQLQRDHLHMTNQEESLSMMLASERKRKVHTERQHKQDAEELRSRINSLTAALEAATLGAKEMKDKASETSRVVNMSRSCQSDKTKSFSRAVQAKPTPGGDKPGKVFQVIRVRNDEVEVKSKVETITSDQPGSAFFTKVILPEQATADEEPSIPMTLQAPPLTWYELPKELATFTPEEPVQSQPQPATVFGHPLAQSEDRPLRPLWPLCLTKDDMTGKQSKQHLACLEKRPETPKTEDRPLRPLWPFSSTNVKPMVKRPDPTPPPTAAPDDHPREDPKPKERNIFRPLWLESLLFSSNLKKSETKSETDEPPKSPDDKKGKKLRFSPTLEHPPAPTVVKMKAPKSKPSAKGRKAKKSDFLRMLQETDILEPQPSSDEFICPYCGHHFPSSTSQTAINLHLRLHSKINSHFS